MFAAPWTQTASGRAVELLSIRPGDIAFAEDVAAPLARQARFAGQVSAGAYSVAQHCVLGCDAVMAETQRPDLAAAFLLHDAHEAYLGDITSPVSEALGILISQELRILSGRVDFEAPVGSVWRHCLEHLKGCVDTAIFAAAGLRVPSRAEDRNIIVRMDIRMLRVERDQLKARPPRAWHPAGERAEPVAMAGRIKIWPWPRAADEWMARLKRYCPHAAGL